ncbi:MAG TPA: DEAD/DEAH box helicase [Gemmatimonadales bacterium]
MLRTVARLAAFSRILAEHLTAPAEPLAWLLAARDEAPAAAVCARAARALLDLPEVPPLPPPWLAPHQAPAAARLAGLLDRFGGALLADAVGLGKSWVALAVAAMRGEPAAVIAPAVLLDQWRVLLARHRIAAPLLSIESLSAPAGRAGAAWPAPPGPRLVIVDEAHRFRNPHTVRYRRLARLVTGARVLLLSATPMHNRPADLLHLFRLFLRDDALAGLGLASLRRAARAPGDPAQLAAVLPRLVVARSRRSVLSSYRIGTAAPAFPRRAAAVVVRAGPAEPAVVRALIGGIAAMRVPHAPDAIVRLLLLRRLASSVPALRASLLRLDAYAGLARGLTTREFQRIFPRGEEPDLQLAFLPLLANAAAGGTPLDAGASLANLLALTEGADDPKSDALARLLAGRPGKTIVFATARATVRHLLRRLSRTHRVAAVAGRDGLLPGARVSRGEVLRAFAPGAQGASPPPKALRVDVLLATDLASEGLDLQDAVRVVHYDLPWTPARLAQRVGRIDRLGSPHARIETVSFLPDAALDAALGDELRLARKAVAAHAAGAAETETPRGRLEEPERIGWCDRVQALDHPDAAAPGACAAVIGAEDAVILVLRIGALADAVVVRGDEARADPAEATRLLTTARASPGCPLDRGRFDRALRLAAPLVRARLALVLDARWRSADREHAGRRLIPLVLADARRSARRGDRSRLARLDALIARLGAGPTAGEELALAELLERRAPLTVADLLAWHARLPPLDPEPPAPAVELVAAVCIHAPGR